MRPPAEYVTNLCQVCEAPVTVLASQARRGRGRHCSRACRMTAAARERHRLEREEFAAYFWSWVDQSGGPDACWPWLGKHGRRGYGRYRLNRRSHFAHRYALTATSGEPSDPTLFALHSCDNPPCCNPAHLRWGTAADNQADRRERGRDRTGRSKIDPDKLREMRAAGLTYSQIASHFGVNQSNIGKMLKREEKRALLKALSAQEQSQ